MAHVVLVTELLGAGRGGGTLSMIRFMDKVRRRGHDITACYRTAVGAWPEWIAGVSVASLAPESWSEVLDDLGFKPDVLICQSSSMAPRVWKWAQAYGVPMVSYMQFILGFIQIPGRGFAAVDESPVPKEVYNHEGIEANRASAAIVANSEFTARLCREIVGMEPAAIVQPPLEPTSIVPFDKPAVHKRRWILNCSVCVAREVGMFFQLARLYPEREFLLLAGGGGCKHYAETIAEASEIPNVTVREDWVDDMGPIYRDTRLAFVGSQTTETFGRAAAEAYTNGIPIIANAVGHLPTLVRAGHGVLVPRGAGILTWREAMERALHLWPSPDSRWNQDHTERFADVVDEVLEAERHDKRD